MKKRTFWPIGILMVIVGLLLGMGQWVVALSTGIGGYSGNPATNGGQTCNVCHSGGMTPTVTIVGPAIVGPGEMVTYTLSISGGQRVAGGFNVSVVSGTLATLPGALDVKLDGDEVTHTDAKGVNGDEEVAFSFLWTAPVTPGVTTMYGAGNSVDGMNGNQGDRANTAVRLIAVGNFTEMLYMPLVMR